MKILVLALLVIAAGPLAFASTIVSITFVALPATHESSSYNSTGATYNGLSTAVIAGFPNEEVVCDDFTAVTNEPSSQIDFSVETVDNLPGARFTTGFPTITENDVQYFLTDIQAYDTAALLLASLEELPVNAQDAGAITDYQYALWDLMEPGATDAGVNDGTDSTTAGLLQTAFAAVLAASPTTLITEESLVIYTPTEEFATNQEFLGLDTPGVPEPATWVLMTAPLLLLWIKKRFSFSPSH